MAISRHNAANGSSSGSSTVNGSLTVATGEIIVVQVNHEDVSGAVKTVTGVSDGVNTYAKRFSASATGAAEPKFGASEDFEVWWALATTSATLTITATLSAATDDAVIILAGYQGFTGTAYQTAPWDTNASLPKTAQSAANGVASASGISTTSTAGMLLAGLGTCDGQVPGTPTGFSLVSNPGNGGGTNAVQSALWDKAYASAQSSITVATTAGTLGWIFWVDALTDQGGGAATPIPSWQAPLSVAPPAIKAVRGFSFVPFNTVQPSNSRNRLEWQQPLSRASQPVAVRPGYSFVPLNTPQVGASVIPTGWQPQFSRAPQPASLPNEWVQSVFAPPFAIALGWQPPLSSSPNPVSAPPGQWQLIVPPPFVVALGWLQPFSAAPPISRGPTSFAYVPFDTAQTQPVTLTYGWQSALSNAPPIVRTPTGFTFVPFDTPQIVAQIASYGWLSALSIAPPAVRTPSSYSYTPFGLPQTVTFAWQPQLSVAPPRQVTTSQASDQVPTWATTPIISLAWLQPLATAAPRPPSLQPGTFIPFYTVQTPLAGIAGMAWFYPLSAAPPVTYSPRGPYAGWAPSPLSTTPPPTPGPLPHNLHYHVTFGKLKSF